ncbi:hypothetical protein, partial [Mycolicibacterium fortuitum]|uniref:hypothetical protein n=1 Tax=Mycolicibacterium fortuitum TaxID=1766 RepID=UPI000AE8D884
PTYERLFSDNRQPGNTSLANPIVAECFWRIGSSGLINLTSPMPAYQRHCRCQLGNQKCVAHVAFEVSVT